MNYKKRKLKTTIFTHIQTLKFCDCVFANRDKQKRNRKNVKKIIGFFFSFVCFEKVQQNNKKVKLIEKIIFRLTMIASFCFFFNL